MPGRGLRIPGTGLVEDARGGLVEDARERVSGGC